MSVIVQERDSRQVGTYASVRSVGVKDGCLRIEMRTRVVNIPLDRIAEWQEVR